MPDQALELAKESLPEVSDQQMDKMCSDLGLVGLPDDFIRKLHTMGIGLERLGAARFAAGSAVFTVASMAKAIQQLNKKIANRNITAEQLDKMSRALGYLSDKVSRVTNAIVKVEEQSQELEEKKDLRRRKSFVPHAIVASSGPVQVNNYFNKPDKQSEETKKD